MTARKTFSAPAIAELLELAGRSMHSIGYAEGLYPAQWTALRYFAKANKGLRTASCLARFQGLAHGPVSRTVRTLVHKELLRKSEDQPIGRAELVEVTDRGYDVLGRDPILGIIDAIEKLPDTERQALAPALSFVIDAASSVWPKSGQD